MKRATPSCTRDDGTTAARAGGGLGLAALWVRTLPELLYTALKERSTTLARIAYRSVVGVEAYFQTWLSSFARRIRTRVSL
jgi:hypothetical protein